MRAPSAARSSRLRGRVADESSRQNASSHVKNAHARLSGGSTSPHLALAKKNTPHLTLAKKTAPHLTLAKKTTPHLTLAKLNLTSPHPANCRVRRRMSDEMQTVALLSIGLLSYGLERAGLV